MEVLQSTLQDAVNQALQKSSTIDEQFGLSPGTSVIVLTTVVLLISLLWCLCTCCCRPKSTKKSAKAIKSTVLFVGPANSGKTTMVHQLAFGAHVDTVPGMTENTLRTKLVSPATGSIDPTSPLVTMVDFPGITQLRASLLRRAGESGALVLVLDATGDEANHDRDAADLIADLFTNQAVFDSAPPLLIAINKSDMKGARSKQVIQRSLETNLRILQQSSAGAKGVKIAGNTDPNAASNRSGGGGSSSGSTGGGARNSEGTTLLLGREGEPFDLDQDSPCPLRWCTSVSGSSSRKDLDEVISFIKSVM